MKKETYTEKEMDDAYDKGFKDASEKMYSEEEVLAMLLVKHDGLTPEYVLEQFKKNKLKSKL